MKPAYFLDRELSWLAFNRRVLAEAQDPNVPLLERLKFLCILSGNLDEFFMIRVAGVRQQILAGDETLSMDGRTPKKQREDISRVVHALVAEAMEVYRGTILPELAQCGIHILEASQLSGDQATAARTIFERELYPVLTPLAVDPGHPFPHLFNRSLNLAVTLTSDDGIERFGVVQVPRTLDRLVPLPAPEGERHFLLLGSLIQLHLGDLFPGHTVTGAHRFRVTRDADLAMDDELEDDPLLTSIERQLRMREWGLAVRLEVEAGIPGDIEAVLLRAIDIDPLDIYYVDGPLQMSDLMSVALLSDYPELKDPPFVPSVRPPLRDEDDLFAVIRRGDVLLHHPYESFDPVVRFLQQAAADPAVLAIKQTLYRTSGNSPIADALARAAENGKQVAALVELRARFDEGSNILWARALERAGAHVVHGLVGLKTHCKLTLVVRREPDGLRRYVHLSTGNYNSATARLYTDTGMLTCDPDIAADATDLFNLLTGYARPPRFRRMAVAPTGLKGRVMDLIAKERSEAEAGRPSGIVVKMNSLVDREVIGELYRASRAGVRIELIVRGICCLKPGIEGLSETITVRSVVDRFLEHERIFFFGVGERREVFLSSADWMPRNFLRRVEVMWPVRDPAIIARLENEILRASRDDNRKAWELRGDGTYERVVRPEGVVSMRSQAHLLSVEKKLTAAADAASAKKVAFIPIQARTEGEAAESPASPG